MGFAEGALSGAATGTAIMPGWGTAIGALGGGFLSWLGNQEESRGLGRGRDLQNTLLQRQLDLYDQGAPLRQAQNQAGLQSLSLLQQYATSAPGQSEFYRRGLKHGLRGLMTELGGYGLSPDSSTAAMGSSELAQGLLGQEEQNKLALLQQLAQGYGGTATAGNLLSQQGQTIGNVAELMATQGANRGGWLAGLGQQVANLPQAISFFGGSSPAPQQLPNPYAGQGWQGALKLPNVLPY